jgi:glycosyltransferase involved in cell wall biosynthesis
MRACMVAYTFYEKDSRVRRYAELLVKRGYSVDAFALLWEGQSERQELINGVRVFRIQRRIKNEKSTFAYLRKLLLFFVRSMFALIREQLKKPYDLIHIHSVPDFEVFAAWYPKLTGSRVILDIHDIVPEFYASKFGVSSDSLTFKLLVVVERLSAAFCDHVISSNHIWQKRLQGRLGNRAKVTTILNMPDTQFFHKKGRNRDDNRFIILYPGSLNYHQGLDLAIHAFVLIKDEVPEADFHIYGSGEQLEFLKSLVVHLKLQDRVFIMGSVPLSRISSVIENADLGIVPKRKTIFGDEAFSTKVLEFMTMGVPVIVPDTAVDKYYFNDSVATFFKANDDRSLADAMLLLIRNAELRKTLAHNATEFAKGYDWNEHSIEYMAIVDSLVKCESSSLGISGMPTHTTRK